MNLIAFRLPDDPEVHIYKAGDARLPHFNSHDFSFLIGAFDTEEGCCQYPLLDRLHDIPSHIVGMNDKGFSFRKFSKSEYFDYLFNIKRFLNGSSEKKTVASRKVSLAVNEEPYLLFSKLCRLYPDAFVFFVSTREFGSWLGASPELLLKKSRNKFVTMSLAGTRRVGSVSPWNIKNIREQEIVTNFITETFRSFGLKTSLEDTKTVKAGEIEHLMTLIESEADKDIDVLSLLHKLSPTPALSGFPKEESVELIRKFEGSRSLYGGFMGPVFPNGDFRLNVVLRCACLSPGKATLFAGGGITCLSDPEAEWEETEKKLDTIRRIL